MLALLSAPAADRYPAKTTAAAPPLGGPAPARAGLKPFGPRADAYVPGLPGEDRPFAEQVRPAFVRPPVSAPDTIETVFLANARPVRVRVTVRLRGKTLAAAWEEHLRFLFAGFDRDRDGYLNRYEVESLFSSKALFGLFANNFVYPNPVGAAYLEDLDKDGDGRLSFAEFAAYYDAAADDLFYPRAQTAEQGDDEALTKELFARLDRNADGKLSKDEMRRAEEMLPLLDADEDECISANELLGGPRPRPTPRRDGQPTPAPRSAAVTAAPAEAFQVYRDGLPPAVTQNLIRHYDANQDGNLTRAEIGLPADRFAQLDANADGVLTAAELDAWRTGPPDAVGVLDISDVINRCTLDLKPTGGTWPAGLELHEREGRAVLKVGTQALDIGCTPLNSGPGMNAPNNETTFPRNKPVVTEADLGGSEYQYIRVVFDAADFDGNGKLTKAEFDRYIGLQTRTMNLPLAAGFAVRTPNLFQLLDDNGDGRLSVRELRTAYDRLIVLEPGGGQEVTAAALQPSAGLRVGRARAMQAGFLSRGPYGRIASNRPTAPLWFMKMDRNGDGDVSRTEFLGPEEAFRKLDADGDGLIAVEEAVRK